MEFTRLAAEMVDDKRKVVVHIHKGGQIDLDCWDGGNFKMSAVNVTQVQFDEFIALVNQMIVEAKEKFSKL